MGKRRPKEEKHLCITIKRNVEHDALNALMLRASDPNHPKHAIAKEQLLRVKRGEIKGTTALRRCDDTARDTLRLAKGRVRALNDDTRAEFLQWLKTEGVVTRIDINPAFAGFPKRKPRPVA